MRAAIYLFLVVITISAANAKYCQSIGYINNFFNDGDVTVRKAFQLGAWFESNGWKKAPIPVLGSVAVLGTCFPGVSPVFGHAGRVTAVNTRDGKHYSFSLTGSNQGCTVSEWHSSCRYEAGCDDVSDWHGLKYHAGGSASCASFYTPPDSADDFFDEMPTDPSPQLPAGSGLCTMAHLRLRQDPGTLGQELVVIPRSREVLDLEDDIQVIDGIAYRAVEYTNPIGESFSGWTADALLGPCAAIHYASDVLAADETNVERAQLTEVSAEAPVERLPGWSIGVMSALGALVLVMLLVAVVLFFVVRYYRRQATASASLDSGYVQFVDASPSLGVTA